MTMRYHRLIATCGTLVLLTAGCQPAAVTATAPGAAPADTVPPVTLLDPQRSVIPLGGNTGLNIALRAQTLGPMRVQDLPKMLADVNHFTASLFRAAPDPAAGQALAGAVASLNRTNNFQVTFADVPAGTYQMRVTAMATADESTNITRVVSGNNFAISTNTVTIAGGTVTYSDSSSALSAVVPLLDGNNNNLVAGPIDVTLPAAGAGSRTTALAGANKVGLTLVNNGSHRATALPIDTSNGFQLVNVQQGAHTDALGNPGGPTHEVWSYAVNSSNDTATPATPTQTAVNAAGAITGPLAINLPVPTLMSTAANLLPTPTVGLTVDGSDTVYYYDGTEIKKVAAGFVSQAVGTPGPVASLTCDAAGNLYWSDGTQIIVKRGAAAAEQAIAGVSNAQFLHIDEEGNLYWYDAVANTGTGTIRKAAYTGQSWQSPADVLTGVGVVTDLAVDPYGNIQYANAAGLRKATLDLAGVSYSATSQFVAQTNISGIAVDRAGNTYMTVSTGHKVFMVGAAQPTIFTVAGTGGGVGANSLTQTVPTLEDLQAPSRPAVSKSGRLYFLSLGTGGSGQFLRWIQ
jgi:hypothetical protein